MILVLLLSITVLFGCGNQDLNTVQKEETHKEAVQQEESPSDTIAKEPVKKEEAVTETERPSDKNTFDAQVVSVTDGLSP